MRRRDTESEKKEHAEDTTPGENISPIAGLTTEEIDIGTKMRDTVCHFRETMACIVSTHRLTGALETVKLCRDEGTSADTRE